MITSNTFLSNNNKYIGIFFCSSSRNARVKNIKSPSTFALLQTTRPMLFLVLKNWATICYSHDTNYKITYAQTLVLTNCMCSYGRRLIRPITVGLALSARLRYWNA